MELLGEVKCEDQKGCSGKGRDNWVEVVLPRGDITGLLIDGA